MTSPRDEAAITAARDLAGSLTAMAGQLATVSGRMEEAEAAARRSKHITAGLIASLCLDLLITAGLGFNTVRQDNVQGRQDSVQSAIITNGIRQCQVANVVRGKDIAIWDRLLQLPPDATAAQKSEAADLGRLVKIKDTPRDCQAAYSTPK